MDELRKRFESKGIKVVSKADSKLMMFLGLLFRLVGVKNFTTTVWTTFFNTIYHGTAVKDPWRYVGTLLHEEQHIDDQRKYPALFQLSYVLGLPFPIGLAYFRAYWEARGYAHNVLRGDISIEEAVGYICSPLYLWPWPKKYVRKMVLKACEELQAR